MARKRRNRIFQFGPLGMDTNLLVVLFFIMVFGFIMIYSASYYKAGFHVLPETTGGIQYGGSVGHADGGWR